MKFFDITLLLFGWRNISIFSEKNIYIFGKKILTGGLLFSIDGVICASGYIFLAIS